MTPREAFLDGLRLAGERSHRLVAYDETFLLATMPQGNRPTATVDSGRGIKVGGIHYWAAELSALQLDGKKVPYRVDPWDIRAIKVLVDSRWVNAPMRYATLDERISERELLIAIGQHRARQRAHTSARRDFERDLIASLAKPPQGKRAIQRAADAAAQGVREIAEIDEGSLDPSSTEAMTVRPELETGTLAAAQETPDAGRPAPSKRQLDRWYKSGETFADYK